MCPQNELKNFGSFRAAIYEAVTRGCGFASATTSGILPAVPTFEPESAFLKIVEGNDIDICGR